MINHHLYLLDLVINIVFWLVSTPRSSPYRRASNLPKWYMQDAIHEYGERVIHDTLQFGDKTSTMLH
jgi:hypothetical protein